MIISTIAAATPETSSLHSPRPLFLSKLLSRFFFLRNAKRKSEHKKFWKRMGGAGGKERTFFKRFFLSPARRIAEQCTRSLRGRGAARRARNHAGRLKRPDSRRKESVQYRAFKEIPSMGALPVTLKMAGPFSSFSFTPSAVHSPA